jgi:hypothetical protein
MDFGHRLTVGVLMSATLAGSAFVTYGLYSFMFLRPAAGRREGGPAAPAEGGPGAAAAPGVDAAGPAVAVAAPTSQLR